MQLQQHARPDDNGHWHMRKEVTLGTLITIVVYAVVLIWTASSLSTRVSIIEHTVIQQKESLDRLEDRTVRALESIDRRLERMEKRGNDR